MAQSSSLTSAASASASLTGKSPTLATTSKETLDTISLITIITTLVVAVGVGLHFSGQLDPVYKWIAEKYFKAEAKAEVVALEKTGSKEAEGYLKDKLKGNPIGQQLGDGELDDIAKGKGVGGAGGLEGKLGL